MSLQSAAGRVKSSCIKLLSNSNNMGNKHLHLLKLSQLRVSSFQTFKVQMLPLQFWECAGKMMETAETNNKWWVSSNKIRTKIILYTSQPVTTTSIELPPVVSNQNLFSNTASQLRTSTRSLAMETCSWCLLVGMPMSNSTLSTNKVARCSRLVSNGWPNQFTRWVDSIHFWSHLTLKSSSMFGTYKMLINKTMHQSPSEKVPWNMQPAPSAALAMVKVMQSVALKVDVVSNT